MHGGRREVQCVFIFFRWAPSDIFGSLVRAFLTIRRPCARVRAIRAELRALRRVLAGKPLLPKRSPEHRASGISAERVYPWLLGSGRVCRT